MVVNFKLRQSPHLVSLAPRLLAWLRFRPGRGLGRSGMSDVFISYARSTAPQAQQIAEALRAGADIVITGRVADPSLTVGPCLAHFGWDANVNYLI